MRHPLICAVGFTGSIPGGRALFDLAVARPVPIPFYGELGSLNPVLVTEQAAAARAEEIAGGLAASYTLGQGQFCTKPGLVLVPTGPAGDALTRTVTETAAAAAPGALLDGRMREHFLAGFAARAAAPGVRTLAAAAAAPTGDAPQAVRAGLLEVDAADLGGELLEECFGPVTVLVRYRDAADAEAVLSSLGGNLTATLHAEAAEPGAAAWLARLSRFAKPCHLRRLAHRCRRRARDDPRRPLPGHHHADDVGRRHRHRPLASPRHLPDGPAGAAAARTGRRLPVISLATRRRPRPGDNVSALSSRPLAEVSWPAALTSGWRAAPRC